MSAHCDCYGTMVPDFARLEKNQALHSPAFTALVQSQGIGVQGRRMEVKQEGWQRCVTCPDDRTS